MSLPLRVISGSLSGVVATAALTVLRKTLASAGIVGETAPEQVVKRLEELNLLEGWSPGARRALAVFAHVGYGAGIGAFFGALRRTAGDPDEEASVGAALGVVGWAANWAGVLPLTGVHKPPWRQHTLKVLLPVVDHAFYGAVWGLVYRSFLRSRGV
jgi:hypothetical protein